jgi:type III pantothenate kinase
MILLVDIGNTALKWSQWSDGDELSPQRVVHAGRELTSVLDECWNGLSRPERVVVASVLSEAVDESLLQWVQQRWQQEPEFVHARQEACGVLNAYRDPERLGVDRWCSLVAVRDRIRGAACVVDCGSALTVDVLSDTGEHLGGLIVPGLAMMRASLAHTTQARAEESGETDSEVALLARDTRGAITGGTLYAAVAFIDRVVEDVAAALELEPERVLTGGDAPRILPLLAWDYRHMPELVLEGLARIARGCE